MIIHSPSTSSKTTTTGVFARECTFFASPFRLNPGGLPMAALVSAALRRKQRRLRSCWRHEQQSIAMVLATVSHHSYSKVDTANALRGQKIGTSTEVGPAEYFELSSDDDSAAFGGLSASTADGGPVGGSAHDRILCFSTWGRYSRFTPRTEFNSTYSGADR